MIYVGIDVGGTSIKPGLVDEDGRILDQDAVPFVRGEPWEKQGSDMAASVLRMLKRSNIPLEEVRSIGAGVPGVVDTRTGHIAFCTNLGWRDVDFVGEFHKHIDKPIFIDNDATVAGLAESAAGVTKGTDSSVFITLGTGVGGGIVIHGKVWSGFHGIGSEIGHMIIDLDGEPCTCGNKGCLERYCSATAIIRMAREALLEAPVGAMWQACGGDLSRMNARIVFDAAKAGDSLAYAIFARYVSYLSRAIANIIQFLDPEVVVLGGGVSNAGAFLLDAVRNEVPRYLMYKDLPYPRIELAKLGSEAGIIGAAMLGR